jgi:hypothetical protein
VCRKRRSRCRYRTPWALPSSSCPHMEKRDRQVNEVGLGHAFEIRTNKHGSQTNKKHECSSQIYYGTCGATDTAAKKSSLPAAMDSAATLSAPLSASELLCWRWHLQAALGRALQ